MLVSITSDTDLATHAQADGDDILFTSSDGTTKLDHEIEYYSSGTLVAWVRIPILYANSDTEIYLYYGNSTATSQENPSGVWDSNYVGVWHLNEEVTDESTSGTHYDSTSNTNDLTQNNNDDITGKIANGQNLDGTADFLTINDNPTLSFGGTAATLQAWVYVPSSHVSDNVIISKAYQNGSHTNPYHEYALNLISLGKADFFTATSGSGYVRATDDTAISVNNWHMIYGIYDGSNITLYVDGIQEAQTPNTASLQDFSGPLRIGANGAAGENFKGYIDEVRISKINRSSDWLATEYNNQNSPSTFFTKSTQEEQPGGADVLVWWKFDEGGENTCSGGTNDVCDSSSLSKDGAITGFLAWQRADLCVSGSCLYFSGSSNYVSVGDDDDFDFGASDSFSIEFWFRHGPASSTDVLAAKLESTGTDGGWRVKMEPDGDITCEIEDDDADTTIDDSASSTSADYDDSAWHHLVCVKDSTSSLTLYLDGLQVAQDSSLDATGSLANDDAFYLGFDGDSNDYVGFIDEFKLYNTALSANQIKSSFTGGSALFGKKYDWLSNGLIGYWRLDEGSGTFAYDYSGNGYDGFFSAASWTPAKFGSGIATSINSSSQVVSITGASAFELGSNQDYTFGGWFKYTTFESTSRTQFITKTSGMDDEYSLSYEDSSGLTYCTHNDGGDGSWDSASASGLNDGNWHSILCVFDQDGSEYGNPGLYIVVDGAVAGSDTDISDSPYSSGSTNFYIGESSTLQEFNSTIDEVRFYNRALTPAETRALYEWAPGPIAYWNLDENNGANAYDRSGSGLNGTITGASWTGSCKFGPCLSFDGSGDYINMGDFLDIAYTDAQTYSFWVKTTSNYAALLSKMSFTNPYNGWLIEILADNQIRYLYQDYSANKKLGKTWNTSDFNDGNWHFISVVKGNHQAANLKLYIDGIEQTNVATTWDTLTSSISTNVNFEIGARDGTNEPFSGHIDEIKIYNYARTQGQIVEDMNAGHPLGGSPLASQVAYWKFDEMNGSTAQDSGPNNQDLTLVNTPTWEANGRLNHALSFAAASSEYAYTADSAALSLTGSLTISAWIKPASNTASTLYDIAGKWDGTNESYLLTQYGDEVRMYLDSASNYVTTNAANLTTNTWYHVAGVYDATSQTVNLYVNGVKQAATTTGTIPSSIGDDAGRFHIGAEDSSTAATNYFDGVIDEVKLYSAALTPAQIKIDVNYGSATNVSAGQDEAEDLADGAGNPPVSYWNFDENTGTTLYDRGSKDNNSSSFTGTPDWVPGRLGSSLYFDGSEYVTIGDPADGSLDFGTNSFTFMLWVYVTQSVGSYDMAIQKGGYAGAIAGYGVALGTSFWSASISDGTNTYSAVFGSESEFLGKWTHLAVVVDRSTNYLRVYTNGKLRNKTSIAAAGSVSTTRPLRFGASDAPSDYFKGRIDDVKIFDYALSRAQIRYHYDRGGPLVRYKFDECSGTTANNSAAEGGNNATITIGASGSNTSAGNCSSGTSTEAWYNGASGKRNYSLDFDGTDDYAATSNTDIITANGDTYTTVSWTAWVNPSTSPTSDTIIHKNNEFRLTTDSSGKPQCEIYSGSWQTAAAATTALPSSTWTHLACVYDGTNIKLYINGLLSATQNETDSITSTNTTALSIGRDPSGSGYFDGRIDEVQIYNYKLSDTQILKILNEGGAVRFGN